MARRRLRCEEFNNLEAVSADQNAGVSYIAAGVRRPWCFPDAVRIG